MANPLENIRDNLRYVTSQHRQDDRECVWGRNRIISDAVRKYIVSPEEFKILCEKLKNKSKVKRGDLSALKQALFNDDNNIALFFSIDGALHSVIRELSGFRAMRRMEAVCCCCNLALGNPKCTVRLTKAATPYLVAHLDGLSPVIVDVCVWAIGNLASGGNASWEILQSQGVLEKLLQLLTTSDDKLTSSIVYSLTHYVNSGLNMMQLEEFAKIATQTHYLVESQPTSYWLMFLLSFMSPSADILINNHMVSRCCKLLMDLVQGNDTIDQQLSRVTALLRIVGNLVGMADGVGAMELLSSPASGALKLLLETSHTHLRKECLWVLANVWGHPNEAVRYACCDHQDVEQALLNTFINIECG